MAQHLLREGKIYLYGLNFNAASVQSFALRMPLYPLFIAAFLKLTRHSALLFIIVQALISTITVFIVYKIALKISGKTAAILAAGCSAFYPYSFVHDTQLQENGLYQCLSLASVWFLMNAVDKKKISLFGVTGILLGIATLTRSTHLIHSIFLILLLLFTFRKNWKQAFLFVGTATLSFFLCLSPWLARNKKVVGSFTLNSEAGIVLAVAHNPYTFLSFPYRGRIDTVYQFLPSNLSKKEKEELRGLENNEMARSRWFQSYALRYIRTHKWETLRRGIYKAAVNFLGILSPLQDPLKNAVYFLSYWALTLLALASLSAVWRTFYFQTFVALSLSQAVVSFIFWAHTSHRSFLDPMLAVLAGIGLAHLAGREKESTYPAKA